MRSRLAIAAVLLAFPGVSVTAPTVAEVAFNLSGRVPARCAIEDQSAARAGAELLIDLQVACNLRTFTLTAAGAANLTLEDYALASLNGPGGAPVVAERGATVSFAQLGPGRHHIRLRVLTPSASARLILDTR